MTAPSDKPHSRSAVILVSCLLAGILLFVVLAVVGGLIVYFRIGAGAGSGSEASRPAVHEVEVLFPGRNVEEVDRLSGRLLDGHDPQRSVAGAGRLLVYFGTEDAAEAFGSRLADTWEAQLDCRRGRVTPLERLPAEPAATLEPKIRVRFDNEKCRQLG
ncbi:MAG: hypothetical protein ACYTGB_19105, partial [Planctomycetota bacterium]